MSASWRYQEKTFDGCVFRGWKLKDGKDLLAIVHKESTAPEWEVRLYGNATVRLIGTVASAEDGMDMAMRALALAE